MNVRLAPPRIEPVDFRDVYEAVSEAAAVAETYSRTAADFAAIGDRRGVGYALRCATAAILNANEIAQSLPRPVRPDGGAA